MFHELTKEDFDALYPKGKKRERLNKAVRREIPGGNEVLDLIEQASHIARKRYPGKAGELADYYLNEINTIANTMREAIIEKYNL